MSARHTQFAASLAREILSDSELTPSAHSDVCVQARKPGGEMAVLDLTPFEAQPQPVTARGYFENVQTFDALEQAYYAARKALPFEKDFATNKEQLGAHVSAYADEFVQRIFQQAKTSCSEHQVRLIAEWVKNLDIYTAVKAVESLLHSKADLALLEVAGQAGWDVHFDHLAIRCGTQERRDAEQVVELLRQYHGYVPSQVRQEVYYQFPEGWNAYPLYKMLDNGQVLRLFIDQSDAGHPEQIIQHWNRVYGFTAHHLAIRATKRQGSQRVAVPLYEIIAALEQRSVSSMTPTGEYTSGLLLQVFTKPEKDLLIPEPLKQEIAAYGEELNQTIQNAKLLELVSRREMPSAMAEDYFNLYGMEYDSRDPLHSAPVYQYFLPAQAAHVIKTSVQAH
jgi:hypothetical protein